MSSGSQELTGVYDRRREYVRPKDDDFRAQFGGTAIMREVCIGCAGSRVESPRFRPVKAGWVGGLRVSIPNQNNARDGLLCQRCYNTLVAEKKVIIHVYPSSYHVSSIVYTICKLQENR